ncbi:MAG: ERAP1-like C-terminal domain-containing protein [Acidobacteria bacterium]|nr:ERAP1-like C-terminal domain-containing protein [Acidobacteriota bacterium]
MTRPRCLASIALVAFLVPLQLNCRKVTPASPNEGVTQELARQRARQIADLRYQLSFEIIPGAERLKGQEQIHLQLNEVADQVTLDFRDVDPQGNLREGAVSRVVVDGQAVNNLRQVNGHLVIPGSYFRVGQNSIEISFETGIASAGRPIIRYQDSDDQSEYIYTLFVPMDASLAFPCFDQPDLKARFTLDLTAPEAWTVVSNSAVERTIAAERSGYRRTYFGETRPLSTYLMAFAAGPLREIANYDTPVPMRIFVRQSKLQRGQEEVPEIARYARDGIRHLTEFFDQPFPFPKFDLLILPGFPYGGMEHAGATFLNEEAMIFPTVPTPSDKLGRAEILLHELSHQWFGNLVTMRWFDDLWLKEGFATYLGNETLASLSDPNNIWKRFYLAKRAAYTLDATKGTTPIYQEVRNLKDAKSAYGAIVYEKAPGLLRYLTFVLGEKAFRDGVRLFLKKHAYGNAEWNDLIQAFEKASGQSLEHWATAWVRQRGMPQIDLDYRCNEQGVIDRFIIKQRNVLGEGNKWPVKTQLLLAYDKATPIIIPTQFSGEQAEVGEVIGKKCPAYVFGNYYDYSYARFLLDTHSQKAMGERLGTISDSFLRTMLWSALWDSVREAEMSPSEYISLAVRLLPTENDEELIRSLLNQSTIAFQRYLSPAQQAVIGPQLEALCYNRMMKSSEQGLRITYFRAFSSIASTPTARHQLKELLAGKIAVPGVTLKSLDRWGIIMSLLAYHDEEAEALLTTERQRDQSDDGRKYSYMAEAARDNAETKRHYFDDYLHNRAVSEDWIAGSLGAFNYWNQSSLTFPYLKLSLDALPQIKRERKIFFALDWLNAFIGGQQSSDALTQVHDFLRSNQLDKDLELKVLEVVDDLERTVRIRSKFISQ